MADTAKLVYTALGGAGEIGMNMYLYGCGPAHDRKWIMVDCGIGFGEPDVHPGIELMVPDVGFAEELGERLLGLFVTHAHEDHVGAVGYLRDRIAAPIYATRFTAAIARRKLQEAGRSPKAVRQCAFGVPVEVGPFSVEFLPVTHSVPEAGALAIRTPYGVIAHTGDFKLDPEPVLGAPADLAPFEALGREGVLALTIDSTNVFNAGATRSEGALREPIAEAIAGCEGAVAATSFASNVARLKTLAEAASEAGRTIVVAGRAMKRMIDVALETGVLESFPTTASEDEAANVPARHLFYLVTGSQGEHRAALARIAAGTHPSVSLSEGDAVLFSSKTIPGNEGEVHRLYNRLSERGVRVIDTDMTPIHASGHAYRDELQAIYAAVRPRIALPMHGEHRHLVEHAAAAKAWGAGDAVVAPNGALVALDGNAPGVIGGVEAGAVYLDGESFVGAYDGVVRDRLRLGRQGHCVVALVVDEAGELIADPEVRLLGAPQDPDAPLSERIAEAVDEAVERAGRREKRKDEALEQLAARAARKICMDVWGKKPVTTVIVSRLEDED